MQNEPDQNPLMELSKEQLIAQIQNLAQQVKTLGNLRVQNSRQTLGQVIDGLNFLLQATQAGDAQSVGEARQLKVFLEQILKGNWTPPKSIARLR